MNIKNLAVVVLAAGKGKRFGEEYTKLLHPLFDKPLIYYPIQNLKNLGVSNIIAVVSDPLVEEEISKHIDCKFVYQKELTGTADAVKLAMPQISEDAELVMVLNGDDATLYTKKTLDEFLDSHFKSKADISMMTLKTSRNMEVGRIIRDKSNNFSKILELKEYNESGVRSNEINCGVYLFSPEFLKTNLDKIQKSEGGEYYLTDLLNIAKEENGRINLYVLKNHSEWIGINDKKDLAHAVNIIKKRKLPETKKDFPIKKVHFLGIAGSGTSACAKLAEAAGYEVSGCDSNLSGEFADILGDVETFDKHDPKHLEGVDILALTPAILSLDPNNPEIEKAKELGIKIMTWQQFLGKYLTRGKTVIAICGTHGKSTTTAMTAKVLEDAGLDPTVLLGATIPEWGSNYRIPSSSLRLPEKGRVGGESRRGNQNQQEYFVIEADEFNNNYTALNPDFTVLTNIEYDHPEFFPSYDDYQNSFRNFLHKTKILILANLSDDNSAVTLKEKDIADINFFPPVSDYSKNLIDFPLKVYGKRNVLNASAAFNLALNLEIDPEIIRESLKSFSGIGRRMELIGEINGAQIYSDFGHHPTEIKVTTDELRQNFPEKQIYVIYQPHMFSRTKALYKDFVNVFKNIKVDGTFIIDIYPSRELDPGDINSRMLVKAINRDNVRYSEDLSKTFNELTNELTSNDILLFMGAGDIDAKIRSLLSS